jgi:hypothetical protein
MHNAIMMEVRFAIALGKYNFFSKKLVTGNNNIESKNAKASGTKMFWPYVIKTTRR